MEARIERFRKAVGMYFGGRAGRGARYPEDLQQEAVVLARALNTNPEQRYPTVQAFLAAYGDGLNEGYLQKFMWTWKPHYYSPDVSFYNYPYAFGLLFATGLYAIYKQRGAAFVADYKNLLASTGEETAAKLAKRFGIDITKRKFWDDSLAIIGQRVDRYCEL